MSLFYVQQFPNADYLFGELTGQAGQEYLSKDGWYDENLTSEYWNKNKDKYR
jgi:hypothetical protein